MKTIKQFACQQNFAIEQNAIFNFDSKYSLLARFRDKLILQVANFAELAVLTKDINTLC